MAEINPSSTAQGQTECNGLECCIVRHSSQITRTPMQRREHRYKNMLHLWEFLLELLADESCRSIICWRKKESGEFKLIDHHEVAKRWGKFKEKEDMNYSKLSRALRLYYQQGIIRKVSYEMNTLYLLISAKHTYVQGRCSLIIICIIESEDISMRLESKKWYFALHTKDWLPQEVLIQNSVDQTIAFSSRTQELKSC